jgi:L-iditol 2-dehydrogenase
MCTAPLRELNENEVLVRSRLLGICGSDLYPYRTGRPGRPDAKIEPGAPGHEIVGEIIESRSRRLKVGDRVLALPALGNGFADYVIAEDKTCALVPDNVSDLDGLLGQQLGTVVHALRTMPPVLDKTVAIVGQGPAGLMFLSMLLGMGAREVVTVEPRSLRRAHSIKLGAHKAFETEAEIVDNAGTAGRFDFVIEAVGSREAIDVAYRLVRAFGTVLHFGLPHGLMGFDNERAFRKQATTLRAVHAQQEEGLACFLMGMELLRRGTIKSDGLISHRLPLECGPEALAISASGDDALKVLIDPLMAG